MKCAFAIAALAALAAGACDKNVKVKSQSDLAAVNGCTTFEADVMVDGVSGLGAVSLDNVEEITGSLVIQNMYDLQTVSLGSLTKVGSFKILNNTNVYKVDVPQLSEVSDFQVITNPNLKELTYRNISSVGNFQIIGTHVTSLGAFTAAKPGNIEMLSNTELKELDFSAVRETKGYISIANNGRGANVTFSGLTTVGGNVSFGDAGVLDISKLASVTDDFSLYTNDFQNLTVPQLETAERSITINDNGFKAISFPKLAEIGSSLNVVNNTKLAAISKTSFPKLKAVPGSIVLSGSFDNLTFPALKTVDGQVSLSGRGSISCKEAEKALSAASNIDCTLEVVEEKSKSSADDEDSGSDGEDDGSGCAALAAGSAAAAVLAAVAALI
ncbi:cell wall protein Ecm33 [Coemansia sp. RSA 552]|nr:cell wall protein Ecm33 [Coemansia sp. RSA 552]